MILVCVLPTFGGLAILAVCFLIFRKKSNSQDQTKNSTSSPAPNSTKDTTHSKKYESVSDHGTSSDLVKNDKQVAAITNGKNHKPPPDSECQQANAAEVAPGL